MLRLIARIARIAIFSGLIAGANPALAQSGSSFSEVASDLRIVQYDLNWVEERARELIIQQQYCRPPEDPKEDHRIALNDMLVDLSFAERNLSRAQAIVRRSVQSNALAANLPAYQGLLYDPANAQTQGQYWQNYRRKIAQLRAQIEAKKEQLRRASVVNCRNNTRNAVPQPDVAPPVTTGAPPPAEQMPPAPPPPDPRLKQPFLGLKEPRTGYTDKLWAPKRLCSEAERQAALAAFDQQAPAQVAKINEEIAIWSDYAQRLRDRKAELIPLGLSAGWQRSFDYETEKAEHEIYIRRVTLKYFYSDRRWIEIMPLTDCGKDTGAQAAPPGNAVPGSTMPSAPAPNAPASGAPDRRIKLGLKLEGGTGEIEVPKQAFGNVGIGVIDRALLFSPDRIKFDYARGEASATVETGPSMTSTLALRGTVQKGEESASTVGTAPPGGFAGFVFIDPLDPGLPFPVGLGGGLTFDAAARTEFERRQVDLIFTTRVKLNLESSFTGEDRLRTSLAIEPGPFAEFGGGLRFADDLTRHQASLENRDFAGFRVDYQYDFRAEGFGPLVEAKLGWTFDLGGSALSLYTSAFGAQIYEEQKADLRQSSRGPVPAPFDITQHKQFNREVWNSHYGVGLGADLEMGGGWTLGGQFNYFGESRVQTILPADGSFAPGAPVSPSETSREGWAAGVTLRWTFGP